MHLAGVAFQTQHPLLLLVLAWKPVALVGTDPRQRLTDPLTCSSPTAAMLKTA